MRSIEFDQATDPASAVRLVQQANAKFIGGGTNLLDLLKGDVEQPARLVDVNHIGVAAITELPNGSLRIGALAPATAIAPTIRWSARATRSCRRPCRRAPRRSCATWRQSAATCCSGPAVRISWTRPSPCVTSRRRAPAVAREGDNRMHAILGMSDACIAVNPSDMNIALAALDAVVRMSGPKGTRSIPIGEFHRLPGSTPQFDTILLPAEPITSVDLPRPNFSRHAHYLKVRDRSSHAFALVSVAAALDMSGGTVRQARIALGGITHKPWRVPAAEALLAGQPLDDARSQRAAAMLLAGTQGFKDNGFKIKLAQNAIVRALREAGESE